MANQNVTQLTQQTGSAALSSLFYAVTGGTTDTGLPLSVFVNNLGLTGVPTAPTAAQGTDSTQIATTAYVITYFAPLASPALTGTPTAPTAASGTNTTQIATTAYVLGSYASPPAIGSTTPAAGNFTTLGTSGLATLSSLSTAAATLTGGSINSTSVGATTASTGSFTTLAASSTVSGTGFTNYLASPPSIGGTTAAAGKFTTLQATSTITPSTTAGIVGTTLGDNAQAGSIGEDISGTFSSVSITTATNTNLTSITLSAGDWDVTGSCVISNTGANMSYISFGLSTTSGGPVPGGDSAVLQTGTSTVEYFGGAVPPQRFNVTSSTTVYLVGYAIFGSGTTSAIGNIFARRRR
jgi:hypothetical protein